MLDKNWKKYLSDIFHYIWVWFIWWAISHGFFSWQRSIIMTLIWIWLFIFWELLQKQNIKNINYLKFLLVWVIYSISIWMINWWLQHFLDSPERSLWIIPLWFLLSLLIFPIKENILFKEVKKNFIFLITFSIFISSSVLLAYFLIPKDFFWLENHHYNSTVKEKHTEDKIGINKKTLNTNIETSIKDVSEIVDIVIIEDNHWNDWHID